MSREHGSHRGVDMQIGIMGLGYVGLPLAVAFAEAGETVIGVDVDGRRVEALRQGRSYVEDIDDERLAGIAGRFTATTRPAALALADAVIICVPTPLTPNREPDLGPLLDAGRTLASRPAARPARRPGVHDLPGHHARAPGAAARGVRPRRRARLRPGLLARARRPGPWPGARFAHDPEGRGRPDRGLRRPRRGALRARRARRSSASPRRRSPRWRSSWRTSSARSTSRWSTSSPMLADRMGIDI